jgi:type I restriction-modification system DNA methylase subunit
MPADRKILILNACVMATGYKSFRDTLVKITDEGFSVYVYNAIISMLGFRPMPIQDAVKSAITILNNRSDVMNNLDFPIASYITNPKYLPVGTNKMSLCKFLCSFIIGEIIEPLENKYKNQTIDISSILYNEFLRYSRADAHDNGIVLTPGFVSELMARLVVTSPKDKILDICTGSGAFLLAAKTRKEQLVKLESDQNYIDTGYFGVELQEHMYFLSYANLSFNNMDVNDLHRCSCYDLDNQEFNNFNATCGLLNPPYSQDKNSNISEDLNEWGFAIKSLNHIAKGGRFACIVPASCGSATDKRNIGLKERLLKDNTLEKAITMSLDLFKPAAGIGTVIYVFTAGIPHDFDKPVQFVDYSNDGYKMAKGKRIATEESKKRLDLMIDICENNKAIEFVSNFKKIKIEDRWVYSPLDEEGEDLGEYMAKVFLENL